MSYNKLNYPIHIGEMEAIPSVGDTIHLINAEALVVVEVEKEEVWVQIQNTFFAFPIHYTLIPEDDSNIELHPTTIDKLIETIENTPEESKL